jgi:hypothetical protein
MKDKKDLTRMPIMKQTRKRRHDGILICDRVILEAMQPTGPVIVDVLPQNVEEQELSSSSQVDEENLPERHTPTKNTAEQNPTEWIMCTSCSKWRILPPDANAATLHVQWTCSVGFASKPNFDCDRPYDLDMPHKDMDHHQKLQAPCMIVKTVKVTLQDDEQLWLLNECGLRPCFTWNDGYSGYRCLAAIRDTTMTLVIQDALSALSNREYCPRNLVEWRTDVVEWRTELQRVQTSLTKEYVKLNRSYWRDDIFDLVAQADDMCIIFVNACPQNDQLRYKVYTPRGVETCQTLLEVQNIVRPLRSLGKNVRGVGCDSSHFCAFYPADMDPNFAGGNCIERWD